MVKIVGSASVSVDFNIFAKKFATEGETVVADKVVLGVGGKGNNQMIAAKSAGAEVVAIERIGDDLFAERIIDFLGAKGISMQYIKKIPSRATGQAYIAVNSLTGQNEIYIFKGTNELLTKSDIYAAESEFKDCDLVLTQFENNIESVLACKELAMKYNKRFILNCAPPINVDDDIFEGIDYITPNETEAQFFTGIQIDGLKSAKTAAEKFLKKGVKNVLITLGKDGSYFYNGEKEIFVPALKVKAVDTTGAGDAYNGGFAVALGEGMDVKKAMQFATCTSAIAVTMVGASSMPLRKDIDSLFFKHFSSEGR